MDYQDGGVFLPHLLLFFSNLFINSLTLSLAGGCHS